MAPEQATEGGQRSPSPALDVYALGAILYECLTARPPLVADDPVETLLRTINEDPLAVRQLNPGVPRDLETITLKCLCKDPLRR
ncbi:serine/threonine protein kinase, partial [Escherichia coli]